MGGDGLTIDYDRSQLPPWVQLSTISVSSHS
jgi:hypothetical protein